MSHADSAPSLAIKSNELRLINPDSDKGRGEMLPRRMMNSGHGTVLRDVSTVPVDPEGISRTPRGEPAPWELAGLPKCGGKKRGTVDS
jgi:hypothetical protein